MYIMYIMHVRVFVNGWKSKTIWKIYMTQKVSAAIHCNCDVRLRVLAQAACTSVNNAIAAALLYQFIPILINSAA